MFVPYWIVAAAIPPERRTALDAMELSHYGINIAALSETRFSDQGKLHETGVGYRFDWIGKPFTKPLKQGVGFAMSDGIQHIVPSEPTGISAVLASRWVMASLSICLVPMHQQCATQMK